MAYSRRIARPGKPFLRWRRCPEHYAFRGADFKNVHSFTQRVPNSIVLKLEENYRSTQGILNLSNWLLSLSSLKYNKKLKANRKAKSTPKVLDFGSDFAEARWVSDDLLERHENGAEWKEHMIITRTSWGARALESSMVEKKIPYRFVGGISLFQSAHVKDLFSIIRAASSQYDELAWARYLTMWPGIGDAGAARHINEIKKAETMEGVIAYLKKKMPKRKRIAIGPQIVVRYNDDPPGLLRKCGKFLAPLLKKRYDNWQHRKRDFDLLIRLAARYKNILSFLETYTLDPITTTDAERLEEDDVVTLTTAHSAKGTECGVCYLIRVEPGMYPHTRSLGALDEEEEERRILYVAMTRAMDELIITRVYRKGNEFAMMHSATGRHSPEGTPYFLQELDESLVDTEDYGFHDNPFSDFETIRPWRSNTDW